MKATKIFVTLALLLMAAAATAQEFVREVRSFSRIIVSPHINLILEEGPAESVRLVHGDFPSGKINVEVKGKTLRIFLDDARVTDKLEKVDYRHRRSIYEDVSITAYVTYKTLDHIQVRGAQEVTCKSPIATDNKFKLKAYGENEITFAALNTNYFKAALFGENRLKIKGGRADYQKYKLYGENRIEASRMKSFSASAMSFGDSEVRIFSQDEVRVTSFGEARVTYGGDAYLSKGLIFGKTDINRIN
jgi:hypothetical protein